MGLVFYMLRYSIKVFQTSCDEKKAPPLARDVEFEMVSDHGVGSCNKRGRKVVIQLNIKCKVSLYKWALELYLSVRRRKHISLDFFSALECHDVSIVFYERSDSFEFVKWIKKRS